MKFKKKEMKKSKRKQYQNNVKNEIYRQLKSTEKLLPRAYKANEELKHFIIGMVDNSTLLSNLNLTPTLEFAYEELVYVIQQHFGTKILPEDIKGLYEDAGCELAGAAVKLAEKIVSYIKLDAILKIIAVR